MATYYRIDQWHKNGTGSKWFFEETQEKALKYVSGMTKCEANDTDGVEHTTIQPFEAETCDMDGWDNFDPNNTEPVHYI